MAETKFIELTDKQKRFCESYVIDWNATRAAKEAGYSEKTAKEQGYQLLHKPSLQNYIEEIQKDLQKLAGVSALRNILELKKIAYSNLHNYKKNWMTLEEWDDISIEDKAAISEATTEERQGKDSVTKIVKFKLYSKDRAIERMNKMLGYEKEIIDHQSKGERIQPTREELLAELEQTRKLRE